MPLTDCASVIMAAELGFDRKYGIRIVPKRETSWAGIRDKLVCGELDAAHVLYGLIYGVQAGIGGPRHDMNVLMTLNHNGQAITLARQLHEQGVHDGESLRRRIAAGVDTTFAQTFPTGTHAMWLYYWLAAHGIDPLRDVRITVVPPPQMVANLRAGAIHGCCVGEPWNMRAIIDRVGFTAATSQDIWPGHPEKVLGTTATFTADCPNSARALTAAVLEAGRWIDTSIANRQRTAEVIARKPYVDTDREVILERMLGRYADGLGRSWDDPNAMCFHADGAVNFPYLSDAMWFMTQHRRWGLLDHDPDYLAVARRVNRLDLYREAAQAAGVALPAGELRRAMLIDGAVWDGTDPQAYAAGFAIRA